MAYHNILVSVIIPVYKVEKYLEQCVASVINQTYKNLEVILVDDESPDNCPRLCDEYADKDNRIKVIHKTNGGSSSARNAGMKIAKGDYVIFIDGDDYWEELFAIEELVKIVNETKSDVVCFGYKEYFDKSNSFGKTVRSNNLCIDINYDLNDNLKELLKNGLYLSSAWSKFIKRDVLLDNNIYFMEGVTSEDIEWSARLLNCIRSISIYSKNFYCYRQRQDSIVHNIKYENLKMLFNNILRCVNYGKEISNEESKIVYYNYVSYQYITLFRIVLLFDDSRVESMKKQMKEYRWLLKYNLNKKVKMIYWTNKLLGYNLMFKMLKLYFK